MFKLYWFRKALDFLHEAICTVFNVFQFNLKILHYSQGKSNVNQAI